MDELIFPREFDRVSKLNRDRRATLGLDDGRAYTFGQHRSRVLSLANAMREQLGLGSQDRFAVLMSNRLEYGELWHAGLIGGGVINPLNSRAHVNDIRYILEDSGAVAVFVTGEYAGMIEQMRSELPRLTHVVLVGGGDQLADLDYESLIDSASSEKFPPVPAETDVAVLMYTGGTTSKPKGVVLTQRGVMLNWRRITESIRPTEDWATMQVVPLFHVGAFVALTLTHLAGGAIAYASQWEPGAVLDAIEEHGLTGLSAVPTMAMTLIEHPSFAPERISTLRFFGYGAAPMSVGLLRRLLAVFPEEAMFVQAYGLTEAGGMVSVLDGRDHRSLDPQVLKSVGRPMAGFDISIRSLHDAAPVPTGEIGEVWLRSGSIMREYWNRPGESAEALADGWFHTGDVGYQDERGYLWLTDRAKDMIISGGENVFSLEVENVLSMHAAVSEVAVIGLPHEQWGESVHAIIRLIEGATVTADEITEYAREHLAKYKVPRSIEFRTDPFPMSAVGKIRKNDLRRGPRTSDR